MFSPTTALNPDLLNLNTYFVGKFIRVSPVCPLSKGMQSSALGTLDGSTKAFFSLALMFSGKHSASGDWDQ